MRCLTVFEESKMLVFVDESGDSGMKSKQGSSSLFVMSAVLFEENDEAEACDKKIEELRSEIFRGRRPEFHFNKMCDAYRERFFKGVADSIIFSSVFRA